MSKRRSYQDKENFNFLNDTISNSLFDPPSKDVINLSNYFSNLSGVDSKDSFCKDEAKALRTKNMYFQQQLNKLENKLPPNFIELVKENAELKAAKEQCCQQLKKTEDMLIKAKEIISHLKVDIKLDTLSQNLLNK